MAACKRKVTLLLLDTSAAFDCVINHLHRLQVAVGIGDTALDWIPVVLSVDANNRPPAEASIATDHLDAFLVDVEAWLKASQLRLNPSKAQVMRLESAQQLVVDAA